MAKSNKSLVAYAIFIALVMGMVFLVIWILTNKDETRTSQGGPDSSISALNCDSSSPSTEAFFTSTSAQTQKHSIKISFVADRVRDLSYVYNGVFNSEKVAENSRAELNAKYNLYMSDNGARAESYNPVFNFSKTRVDISIYADGGKLDIALAPIFFMTNEEFSKIKTYSKDEVKKIYDEKGFTCKYHE